MVDDGDNITSVRSYGEAVLLYLWDRHNEVNLRLIEPEQADDPVFPKDYFPSVYHCPSCFPDEVSSASSVQFYFSVKLIQSLNSCYPYIFKLRIQLDNKGFTQIVFVILRGVRHLINTGVWAARTTILMV